MATRDHVATPSQPCNRLHMLPYWPPPGTHASRHPGKTIESQRQTTSIRVYKYCIFCIPLLFSNTCARNQDPLKPGSPPHESNLSTIQNCFIQLSPHDLSLPALLQSNDMGNLSLLSVYSQHPFFMDPMQRPQTSRVASVPVHTGVDRPTVRSRTRTPGPAESWKTSSRPGAPRSRGPCRVRPASWRPASSRTC